MTSYSLRFVVGALPLVITVSCKTPENSGKGNLATTADARKSFLYFDAGDKDKSFEYLGKAKGEFTYAFTKGSFGKDSPCTLTVYRNATGLKIYVRARDSRKGIKEYASSTIGLFEVSIDKKDVVGENWSYRNGVKKTTWWFDDKDPTILPSLSMVVDISDDHFKSEVQEKTLYLQFNKELSNFVGFRYTHSMDRRDVWDCDHLRSADDPAVKQEIKESMPP